MPFGAILGAAALGYLGSKETNSANKQMYNNSLNWEREKAMNAHQWEVEDLRKAGLNPILSAGGKGASAGSPTVIPAQNELGAAANSALQAYNAYYNAELLKSNAAKTAAETQVIDKTVQLQIDSLRADLANAAALNQKYMAEIENIRENTRNQEANNYFLKEGIDVIRPIVDRLKDVSHNATSDTSWIDDVSSGFGNTWKDIKNYYFGKDSWDSPTPNHKNNDYMKNRRGRS